MEAGIQNAQNQTEGKGQEWNVFFSAKFLIKSPNFYSSKAVTLSWTRFKYLTNAYPNTSFPSQAWFELLYYLIQCEKLRLIF